MKILNIFIIILINLAVLNVNHFNPWATFDSEKNIFYASVIILLCFILKNKKEIKLETNIIFLILLFFISLSSYHIYEFKQYFYIFNLYLLNLVLISVALKNNHNSFKLLNIILISVFISGSISSLFAIYQWQEVFTGAFWLYEVHSSRFSANLAQPNHLSTLVLLSLLACLYMYKKFNLKIILFFIPLFIFSVILTQSRSALLALILISILSVLKAKKISKDLLFILLLLAPVYLGFSKLLNKVNEKINVVGRAGGSFERLEIWQDFFQVYSHVGFWGAGWRNIENYQFEFGSNFSGYLFSYHNLFFDLLVIFGVIGGVFFIYVFYNLLKIFFKIDNNEDFVVFLMVLVLVNYSMLEFPLFYNYFLLIFCVLYFYLDNKYSKHIFNLDINKYIYIVFTLFVLVFTYIYICIYDDNRSNYRALFLGYCVDVKRKSFVFDEFDNLAIINCKENISSGNLEIFEKGLLMRPSKENILKMIYVYHAVGDFDKRDKLLNKYNSRYSLNYDLSDVLKMKFY